MMTAGMAISGYGLAGRRGGLGLAFLAWFCLAVAVAAADAGELPRPGQPVAHFVGPAGKGLTILIQKQQRRLYLLAGDHLLRSYPIKLGRNPRDDKARQGDLCTPEGRFYVCTKNPRSKYHLSLGLSYPNIEDARRGLRTGLISRRQYSRIIQRIRQRRPPPWDTALGGEIFIHGRGQLYDWTYGCIALSDRDMENLFRLVPVGTEVIIEK